MDAIVALSQRTVFVASWAPLHDGFRTLVNSARAEALPIFTDLEELMLAAARFGWLGTDGHVAHREIGAREAFQAAVDRDMPFLVLDVASEHALEIQREELEPLLGAFGRRESTGPFAAVGRISSTMLEAASRATPEPSGRPQTGGRGSMPTPVVRPSTMPGSSAPRHITPPASPAVRPSSVLTPEGRQPSSSTAQRPISSSGSVVAPRTASTDHGVTLTPVQNDPDETLLDHITNVLKAYPEVEWASYCLASEGGAAFEPAIGVRVDPVYRQRVDRIAQAVIAGGAECGHVISLLLLDDPSLLREARNEGLLFYPWKRRSRPG